MTKKRTPARVLALPPTQTEPDAARVAHAEPLAEALALVEDGWCGRPVWRCPLCQYVNTNQTTAAEHLRTHEPPRVKLRAVEEA